jgi:hypothetical protein
MGEPAARHGAQARGEAAVMIGAGQPLKPTMPRDMARGFCLWVPRPMSACGTRI